MTTAQSVLERWKNAVVSEEEGLRGAEQEPLTEAQLVAFERGHGLRLPASFRDLYLLSDGTSEMDGHEQIFWPLSAIENTLKGFDAGDPDAHWIGFADYRLQTSVFYLRICRADGAATVWHDPVVGGGFPARLESLTDSFDAFLSAYAADPLFWREKAESGRG
jgi:hypothetical protein